MTIRWIDQVKAIPALPPQVRTLMISAGHSDTQPGVVANGYREAEIVMEFRQLVSASLVELGIKHLLDGEPGENLPLRDAVVVAQRCDIAVEFHCNGAASSQATGVETLSREADYSLGAELCRVTADSLGIANRGPKPEGSGQHHRLAFVSDGGGVIHELFFLSNKRDLATWIAGKHRLAQEVARILAQAARTP